MKPEFRVITVEEITFRLNGKKSKGLNMRREIMEKAKSLLELRNDLAYTYGHDYINQPATIGDIKEFISSNNFNLIKNNFTLKRIYASWKKANPNILNDDYIIKYADLFSFAAALIKRDNSYTELFKRFFSELESIRDNPNLISQNIFNITINEKENKDGDKGIVLAILLGVIINITTNIGTDIIKPFCDNFNIYESVMKNLTNKYICSGVANSDNVIVTKEYDSLSEEICKIPLGKSINVIEVKFGRIHIEFENKDEIINGWVDEKYFIKVKN